jgi:hypothetical protein
MELFVTIDRDFPVNDRPYLPADDTTIKMIMSIAEQFVNFDDFTKINKSKPKSKITLIDTCSIIKNEITQYKSEKGMYVITCGVLLEILQGATKKTITNEEFMKDIKKILDIKKHLGNNCVFLSLGRRHRAYWNGCEPSRSCRNCINVDQPHYKILRDIDTELYRLSVSMNWDIDTCDYRLHTRSIKHRQYKADGTYGNPHKKQSISSENTWTTIKSR